MIKVHTKRNVSTMRVLACIMVAIIVHACRIQ